jgi:dGTPase
MSWNKYLNEERLKPTSRNKDNDDRNEFESDYGRIIFSPAIRRMHDKTQVFPLTTDDNIHSRLTHSLEVMSVGESIALNVLKDSQFKEEINSYKNIDDIYRVVPVIVKNACLVHDIGNPPFGHFGETVIQEYFAKIFKLRKFSLSDLEMQDFEKFDGNAQGFRVLTKLQMLDDKYGLNLTFGTLGAYLKYPNPDQLNKEILSRKKRGVFQSERDYCKKVMDGLSLIDGSNKPIRHPLSFVMEAADSICYLIMDIEDGFNKKWYSYEDIKKELYDVEGMSDEFVRIEGKYKSDIAKIVNLRLSLIRRLVLLSVKNYVINIKNIYVGNYNHELIDDDDSGLAIKLKAFCKKNILEKKEIISLELTGHSVLKGLFDYYIEFCFDDSEKYRNRALNMISKSVLDISLLENNRDKFEDMDDYYKIRVIVDYITGMTDQYALNQFQRLSGQKIN